jgi:inorganic phosphate transporter, PiT family
LNSSFGDEKCIEHLDRISSILERNKAVSPLEKEFNKTIETIKELRTDISLKSDTTIKARFGERKRIQSISKTIDKIVKDPEMLPNSYDRGALKDELHVLKSYTDFAPDWALMMVALSLGIGTMIGWKRIVVTIGEKIGKSHLTYGQGAASELVAASTIGLSTYMGLPVSTTHVLSSGIAGSMVATGGVKNLQKGTVQSIAIAWILTLPVTILLSFGLYLIFRLFA